MSARAERGRAAGRAAFAVVAALSSLSGCTCGGAGRNDGGPGDAAVPGTDAAPPTFDPATVPENATSFPFGIASGDMDAESAILWTRYLGTETLRLRVLEWDGAAPGGPPWEAMPVDELTGAPNDTGIVKRVAPGLRAGARYSFMFLEEDAAGALVGRSRVGTFRTPPDPGTLEPVTFAISGDANDNFAPYPIMTSIAAEDVSFFVMNGDTVYADGASTRDEYRSFYESNFSDTHWQDLGAAMGWYTIWDDHEVANNWDADTIDPTQVADARAAFLEYTTIREDPAAPERLWRSYRWGDTVEVFVLDCRGERAPSMDQYISPEQMEWLKNGLLTTTALYKVIVNSVPITDLGFIGADDRWDGFPVQRAEILGHIATNAIPHVFWLSADIHISVIGRLDEYGGVDIVSGPIGQVLILFAASILQFLPSVEYSSAEVYNYHLVTIDPTVDPPTLTVSMRGEDGAEFFTRTFTE